MALSRKPIEIVNDGKHQLLVKAEQWKRIFLNEVAIVQNGYAFSSSGFVKTGGMPLIRIRDIDKNNTIDRFNGIYTNEYVVKRGDVLIGMDGDFKVAIWKGEDALLNQRVCRIKPKGKIFDFKFLYLCLQPYLNAINSETSSVTVKHLSSRTIEEIPLPFPPLPEQQAIVAKIEELFSELDNGKQQLLTAQAQLKVYRQSLLKWAFEGKLTNKDVKEGELPEGWKWIKSGELFSFVTSGSRGWAKYYSDKGDIFIRITNMNFDTLKLDLRKEKIQNVNPPSNAEGIRTKVQEGDFLFSITGYLGMFAIAPKLENAFVNQHVCLCRPKEGFNKEFVGYWIISRSGGIHFLNKLQKGAVKAGLNLDDLKTFPVPLCSIEEQQIIVSTLESKLTVCDKIEETISQSLQQIETLRQSILKKAFEGKLITTIIIT